MVTTIGYMQTVDLLDQQKKKYIYIYIKCNIYINNIYKIYYIYNYIYNILYIYIYKVIEKA